jgi:hypothetical protein
VKKTLNNQLKNKIDWFKVNWILEISQTSCHGILAKLQINPFQEADPPWVAESVKADSG